MALRTEVGRLRAREQRRVFDSSVHIGVLAGTRVGFVARAQDRPALDMALRTEVIAALLEAGDERWGSVWLRRAGTPEAQDVDFEWLSAARMAFGMHGRNLDGCYVVTRSGWRDVISGQMRVWARLRL